MKEAIRRIYYALVWAGLADAEVEATAGTPKHKFLCWLYGNAVPMFDTQWPDDETQVIGEESAQK